MSFHVSEYFALSLIVIIAISWTSWYRFKVIPLNTECLRGFVIDDLKRNRIVKKECLSWKDMKNNSKIK